ncbi:MULTISPECIES: hypothetical protein [Methylosinus]|uniref:Uncharacterized protein n=1 Tax=Methylosinus trichosporium (strain ATCC 35070 / NCIMB 11131 / UNIQEM 75 / OB3b) TaxID=595536 RepID=A0A2D2CW74_METT3|nr:MULTISPECIES: hypothetical protein [Methylosinus]ATQ66916.1 hypothetical protein CQW49_02670 [Methylosinus trichosporium OB3b]OBS54122.1 hypothetical protein A8B73_02475 [Methylosinus sp. 3S-1]
MQTSFRFAATALLLAPFPALAQTPALERVLSATTLYLSENGGYDLAILVDNRDSGADLYLYFGVDPNAPEGKTKPSFVKKNAAWVGGGAGALPSLAVSDKGSLLIKSENDAIGRDRWSETLTVVRRNGALVVAGLTFTARDTLEPEGGGSCDLNFLTGKGTRNGKKIELKAQTLPLADWSVNGEALPKECRF